MIRCEKVNGQRGQKGQRLYTIYIITRKKSTSLASLSLKTSNSPLQQSFYFHWSHT